MEPARRQLSRYGWRPRTAFHLFASRPGRNHFALDVGVDRHDVTGALDAFTDGGRTPDRHGRGECRTFLDNVSPGIYGHAVRSPSYRDAKVRMVLEAAAKVMGPSTEAPALCLVDDLGREHRHLAVVFVSDNPLRR